MDKVSFIITVYKNDKLEFFREAIESIVNQDYGFDNINIYLGIDGELHQEVFNYINNSEYFYKIIRNKQNKGLAYTLNRLIKVLENEKYIFRMDSDDVCKLDRVSKQIKFMDLNKTISIIGGSIEEILEDGSIRMKRTYPKSTEEAKVFIPKASVFAHPTVCFRKSFFDKQFIYNEQYKFSQDLALWYEALSNNIEISNIDDVVLQLRITNDFYKRRSYKKAFGEFIIYKDGIIKLYGYNWRLIYPIVRFIIRLLPPKIVKLVYGEKFRKILNCKKGKNI